MQMLDITLLVNISSFSEAFLSSLISWSEIVHLSITMMLIDTIYNVLMSVWGSFMGNVSQISKLWVTWYVCNSAEGKIKIFVNKYIETQSFDWHINTSDP